MPKDASTVTHLHQCPRHTSGGILPPGGPGILAGGNGPARFGDRLACSGGAPDAVLSGSSMVLMGGLPAAGATDKTAHGGMICQGLTNVEIGGPTVAGAQASTWQPWYNNSNTFIAYDPNTGRMFVVSYLEYHGRDASEAYAAAAKAQIEAMWGGMHDVRGVPTEVIVQVNTSVRAGGDPTPGYDQIEVNGDGNRSWAIVGGAKGRQCPTDADPDDYAAAHEFGHTMGLHDEYKKTPNGAVPDPAKTQNLQNNIMAQIHPDDSGVAPHPYPDHYDKILTAAGL